MTLPIELIDEVIRYLAYNIQSLRRCSLVAKPWVHLCRKWLFQDIVVTRKTHQLWLDSISSRDVELLRNVRSFTYISDPSVWNAITPYRIDSLHRYMHALGRLKFLELSSMFLGPEVLQQIELFSAFQHTLTSLNLTGCCVTSSALVTTINYFPGLVDLNLYSLTHEVDGSLAPPLSRPLRGKLCIGRARTQDRALFNKLSNPPPELDELRFHGVHMPLFYDCILSTHGGSVKRLILEDSCIGGTTRRSYNYNLLAFPTLIRNTNIQQKLSQTSLTVGDFAKWKLPHCYWRRRVECRVLRPLPQQIFGRSR